MARTCGGPSRRPEPPQRSDVLRLLIVCPDGPGIISAVSRFLFQSGANIVRSDQYSSDPEGGTFYLRMEFTLPEARAAGARGALRRRGGQPA